MTHACTTKRHGNAVAEVVPCGVHPLHLVRVRVSGARDGCPLCAMQIEDLCRSMSRDLLAPRSAHAPRLNRGLTMIIGCTCGWTTPPGTTDSDDAFSVHLAISSIHQQEDKGAT